MADIKGNILKVRLGNDTRRQMLYNTNISYNDLVLMLQRIYSGKLKPSDDIALKYFDEDGDLITVVDDADFAHAREYCKTGIVNMVVYVNGKDVRTCIDGMGVANMRQELSQVRDKVNTIIDTLANQTSGLTLQSTSSGDQTQQLNEPQVEQDTATNNVVTAVEKVKPVPVEALSIFDPFKSSSTPTLTTMASSSSVATATIQSAVNTLPQTSSDTSTSNTSHLFQNQDNSSFLDQSSSSNSQIPAQQTGQMVGGGAPQTGQQLTTSGTSTPNPSQQQQATGTSGYYSSQGINNTPTGGGAPSSYAIGQSYRPPGQYPSSSQTGQQVDNYSTSSQANYGNQGYTGGATFPTQSSAPTPPSSMPSYPSGQPTVGIPPTAMPTGRVTPGGGYPPTSYSQPQTYGGGPPPPAQPSPYGTQYPMQGGAGRGRINYGNAYKVGYTN